MTDMQTDLHKMLANKEQPELEDATQLALTDRAALKGLLTGVVSRDDAYRYNCFKVLYRISEEHAQVLYLEWDYFVGLLDSDNAYHRSVGVQLLANLASADEEHRFEGLFDRYFDLLDDDKVMVARYLAQHVGRIVKAKSHLQTRIAAKLLDIDSTHHSQGRKDLLKGDAIQAFDEFFTDMDDKESILAYVEAQLTSSSPKTRKTARAFLDKYR